MLTYEVKLTIIARNSQDLPPYLQAIVDAAAAQGGPNG